MPNSSTLFGMRKFGLQLFLAMFMVKALFAGENFIVIDQASGISLMEVGDELNFRVTPASTFKIPLCLIGFDAAILHDGKNPIWPYCDGYDDFLEVWKQPQTPQSWLRYSCVWYSRVLLENLGHSSLEDYIERLDYGNCDISGKTFWISSSLAISPREQVAFLRKMLGEQLLVSSYSLEMTKELLYREELEGGWKLFGKTGLGEGCTPGWFIGWIEKESSVFPFAYCIIEEGVDVGQRVPRAKELLRAFLEGL